MIYLWLFLEFLKIGIICFGGGYSVIPFVKEVVLKHNWIKEDIFYDFIGVAESTPGPIAVNLATYVGSEVGGFFGALVATLGVCLPPFIIILLITLLFKNLISNKHFKRVISGIQPTIIALIFVAGIALFYKISPANPYYFSSFLKYLGIVLLIIISCLTYKIRFNKKLPSIAIILVGLVSGLIIL